MGHRQGARRRVLRRRRRAQRRRRTVFAVGDDKQSIFSFQDAAPLEFDDAAEFFDNAHKDAGLPFQPIKSIRSFRSAPVVLNAVDVVFRQPAAHRGLTADPVPTVHEAVRAAAPGLVELWPLERPDEKEEIEAWDEPFDIRSETSSRVKLARKIAGAVKAWLGAATWSATATSGIRCAPATF